VPADQANKGWAGDCVQLRVKTDLIAHVDCWYSAPCQEPFIGIAYGKSLTEPFGGGEKRLFRTEGWKLSDGAEMAFLKDRDGKGYVQEIKLPWAVITKDRQSRDRKGAVPSWRTGRPVTVAALMRGRLAHAPLRGQPRRGHDEPRVLLDRRQRLGTRPPGLDLQSRDRKGAVPSCRTGRP